MPGWRWTPRWRPVTSPRGRCRMPKNSARPKAGNLDRKQYPMSSSQTFSSLDSAAATAAATLRTTVAVRERARQLLLRARSRESAWFTVDDGKMDATAAAIADTTRKRYPKLRIPLHSRWRHFAAGGIDRKAELDKLLLDLPEASRPHALID